MCTYRPINSYLLSNDSIGQYRFKDCCHTRSLDLSRTDDVNKNIDELKRIMRRLEATGQQTSSCIKEYVVRTIDAPQLGKGLPDYHEKHEIKLELARLKRQLDDLEFSVDASLRHRANCSCWRQPISDAGEDSAVDVDDDVSDFDDYDEEEGRRSRSNLRKDFVDGRQGSVYHLNCHEGPFDASYNNNVVAFNRSKSFDKLPKNRNLRSRSPSPTRRYFKPQKAGDLRPGDWVKFKRRTHNNFSSGQCKYVGHLPGKSGVFIGVELKREAGKNSGCLNGFEYFKCKSNQGIFVPFDKILQAWTYTS